MNWDRATARVNLLAFDFVKEYFIDTRQYEYNQFQTTVITECAGRDKIKIKGLAALPITGDPMN